MSIFKRPKANKKRTTKFHKSTLPDYITGKDSVFTYTTHTQRNEDGSKKVYFMPVRRFKTKVEKVKKIDGKDASKWFLKLDF